ncbi:MAG: DedA family protein [Halobacteriales archaeon]|nr:DedA family protein [Halobacteriales archaeon]
MALLGAFVDLAVSIIGALGYPGVALLMAAESMLLPVPSEAVMPFAGYLVYLGAFRLDLVIVASVLGSIAGSLLSYAIGVYGGRPLLLRYGRYLLIREHELAWTEEFFARRGAWAVLVARFVPVVRHIISIPAGVARMPLGRFLAATILGAACWNALLAWAGLQLGPRWDLIRATLEPYEIVLVAAGALVVVLWVVRQRRAARGAA